MKDSIFWRVIGVGLVVGLFMIGYGLCKNSQPSPSLSSVAYADEPTPEKPVSKATLLAFKNLSTGQDVFSYGIKRAKVPGGWLIMVKLTDSFELTFYPDPKHEWDGGSSE
ncbi:MAG: hypothetical protein ABSG67_22525 [Thermoguttaceae bacterium]|jgi:hypothetical protein